MSELVDMVHKAEDKYRPVGEYPSVRFIPEDSIELKQIRKKVQHDGMAEATENVREGIRLGMTKREMSRKYQISFTQIRKIIEANNWEDKVIKEKRNVYLMFNIDGEQIDCGTVTQLSQRHDVAPSSIYASAYANSVKSGIVHQGDYFVNMEAQHDTQSD